MALTAKQEAFALHYFEQGNAAEAYRQSYDVEENARDSWIYVEACQLLDNPKVALRLQELKERARELAIFNRHQALEEFEAARQLAMKSGAASAAVSAVNGKVKLFGLEPKRSARVEHTGPNGGPIRTSDESKSEAELIEQAQKLGIDPAALGLVGGAEEED
ncbi:MAG: terminase small subunit [Leisingera sp.]